MDPLTHALSGALVARAAAPSTSGPGAVALPLSVRAAAGAAAALFPDVDFALRLAGTLTYLNWHQGPTHSLVLLPVWGFGLAHLFALLGRRRYRWQAFFPVACLGLAAHVAGDFATAYGVMLFAPLTAERFSLPLAFVIDPWVTGIIAAGLLAAIWLPQAGRAVACLALLVLAGYFAFLAVQRDRALALGEQWRAKASPHPHAQVHALPQPLSPYHWKILVGEPEVDHVALVSLRGGAGDPWARVPFGRLRLMASAYRPEDRLEWRRVPRFGEGPQEAARARDAWAQPAFAPFRRFAAFPTLERLDHDDEQTCAWFVDQRFVLPAMPPSFRFGVCRRHDEDAPWRMVRARGLFWID